MVPHQLYKTMGGHRIHNRNTRWVGDCITIVATTGAFTEATGRGTTAPRRTLSARKKRASSSFTILGRSGSHRGPVCKFTGHLRRELAQQQRRTFPALSLSYLPSLLTHRAHYAIATFKVLNAYAGWSNANYVLTMSRTRCARSRSRAR